MLSLFLKSEFTSNLTVNNKNSEIKNIFFENKNFNNISTWHVFGKNEEEFKILKNNNIKLMGIIFNHPLQKSQAIINIHEKDYLFRVGENIDNHYTLYKIEETYIVLKSENGFERLEIFEQWKSR